MDEQAFGLLESTKVKSIAHMRDLVILKADDSITKAMQVLAEHQITGAPVADGSTQNLVGFVDVLDLAVFVAYTYYENFQKHPHLYDPKELRTRFMLPVREVINASKRDPFWSVNGEESLSFLVNNFLRAGIHRVPVVENSHVGIVTQSDVVKFLAKHIHTVALTANKTVEQLGLDRRPTVTIRNDAPLIEAFNLIIKNGISGLAVVDFRDGRLVNNLSASDLKGITEQSFFRLEVQLHQIFMSLSATKLPPVTCKASDRLGDIILRLEKTGVHRVYVVDDMGKPISTITLTEILGCFSRPSSVEL